MTETEREWKRAVGTHGDAMALVGRLMTAVGLDGTLISPDMLVRIVERGHQAGVELTNLKRDEMLAGLEKSATGGGAN